MAKTLNHKTAHLDVQIGAGMVVGALLSDEGVDHLKKLLAAAKNPVMVLCHVLFLVISQVKAQLKARNMPLDSRAWQAKGGILDRVLVEVMTFIATALQYKLAGRPEFVDEVKRCIIALMNQSDKNSKAIKVLHDKKLPIPYQDPGNKIQTQGPPDPRSMHALKKHSVMQGLLANQNRGGTP